MNDTRNSEGWHPKDLENDAELMRWEIESCRQEIVRLRTILAAHNIEWRIIK